MTDLEKRMQENHDKPVKEEILFDGIGGADGTPLHVMSSPEEFQELLNGLWGDDVAERTK